MSIEERAGRALEAERDELQAKLSGLREELRAVVERLKASDDRLCRCGTDPSVVGWEGRCCPDCGAVWPEKTWSAKVVAARLKAEIERLKAAPVVEPGGFVWLDSKWRTDGTRQGLSSAGGCFKVVTAVVYFVLASRDGGPEWRWRLGGLSGGRGGRPEEAEAKAAAERWADDRFGDGGTK